MNSHLNSEYIAFSDEELVNRIRNSDADAFACLYSRYFPKIRAMAYPFQGLGYDLDDLVQEAAIGFYTAINVYNGKDSSFSTFSYLCMRRMLISLVRANNRKGNIPKDSVINSDDISFGISSSDDPEQLYIAKENFLRLKNRILSELSKLERNVLFYYIAGYSYDDISEKLNISKKSVNNALQRMRYKLR